MTGARTRDGTDSKHCFTRALDRSAIQPRTMVFMETSRQFYYAILPWTSSNILTDKGPRKPNASFYFGLHPDEQWVADYDPQSVLPDWAIYWTLGNFLKPLPTINLSKSPTFLGNFCKRVKIYHFLVKSF